MPGGKNSKNDVRQECVPEISHVFLVRITSSVSFQNPNGTESEEEHDTFNDSDSLFPEQDLELPPMQHPDPGIKATSRAPSLQGSHCSAELFPSNTTATSGTTPQNVKTLTQVLLEHQYFPSDPNQPDPPVNTSRALKERFNHTLLQNAKARFLR